MLRKLNDSLEQLGNEIDSAQARLVNVMGRALAGWYVERAKEFVKSDPERSERLGREHLREMKEGVTALSNTAELQVKNHLKRSNLWWDGNGSPEKLAERAPYMTQHALIETYNACRDQLANVLAPYGYMRERPIQIENLVSAFANEDIPYGVKEVAAELSNIFQRGTDLLAERSRVERGQAETIAADIWDEL